MHSGTGRYHSEHDRRQTQPSPASRARSGRGVYRELRRRLACRKMLITTGILLGVVLLVMVGEQAQEMQLAHWIPTTQISRLSNVIPPWMGMWFAIFPTVETLVAQLIAAVLVIGSYYAARHFGGAPPQNVEPVEEARLEAKVAITEQLEAVP